MSELPILQAMRLKGRLSAPVAASCVGISIIEAQTCLEQLIQLGDASAAGQQARLTVQGRTRLRELLTEERRGIDTGILEPLYEEFDSFNNALKRIVTDWQLRDEQPNDHSDQAYDQVVIDRLIDLDSRFTPLLARFIAEAGRLRPYQNRFAHAVRMLREGDQSFVARPVADSYHTLWFELHEDLIGLLGRTRAAEAAAGRAV